MALRLVNRFQLIWLGGDGIDLVGETLQCRCNSRQDGAHRSAVAGVGLTGGGDLSNNRTFAVNGTVVRTGRIGAKCNGLTGGGYLTANRTLSVLLASGSWPECQWVSGLTSIRALAATG